MPNRERTIQILIDIIHNTAASKNESQVQAEIQYFLRRIPPGAEVNPMVLKDFSGQCWRLGKQNAQTRNNGSNGKSTPSLIDEPRSPGADSTTWRDELAYRTGISVDLIEELHNHLLRVPPSRIRTTSFDGSLVGGFRSSPNRCRSVSSHAIRRTRRV